MSRAPESPSRDDDNVERLHPGHGKSAGAGRRVAAEDLERVVRRAAQMQQRAGEPGQQALTEEEVIRIGRQVGLEPGYVRRALAEVHAESLLPAPAQDSRLFNRLAGEGWMPVRRLVPGEPEALQGELETCLPRKKT